MRRIALLDQVRNALSRSLYLARNRCNRLLHSNRPGRLIVRPRPSSAVGCRRCRQELLYVRERARVIIAPVAVGRRSPSFELRAPAKQTSDRLISAPTCCDGVINNRPAHHLDQNAGCAAGCALQLAPDRADIRPAGRMARLASERAAGYLSARQPAGRPTNRPIDQPTNQPTDQPAANQTSGWLKPEETIVTGALLCSPAKASVN